METPVGKVDQRLITPVKIKRKRLLDDEEMKVVNRCVVCSLDMGEGITNRQLCGKYRCYNEELATDLDSSIEILNITNEVKKEEEKEDDSTNNTNEVKKKEEEEENDEDEEEEDMLTRFVDGDEFEALWRENIHQLWNSLPIDEIFYVRDIANNDDLYINDNQNNNFVIQKEHIPFEAHRDIKEEFFTERSRRVFFRKRRGDVYQIVSKYFFF